MARYLDLEGHIHKVNELGRYQYYVTYMPNYISMYLVYIH